MSALQDFSRDGSELPLPRDENRFRYFYPNGKPILPANAEGPLTVKTTYERVMEQASQA
jgi:hypothetical protein